MHGGSLDSLYSMQTGFELYQWFWASLILANAMLPCTSYHHQSYLLDLIILSRSLGSRGTVAVQVVHAVISLVRIHTISSEKGLQHT